jgi:hypothetical protein
LFVVISTASGIRSAPTYFLAFAWVLLGTLARLFTVLCSSSNLVCGCSESRRFFRSSNCLISLPFLSSTLSAYRVLFRLCLRETVPVSSCAFTRKPLCPPGHTYTRALSTTASLHHYLLHPLTNLPCAPDCRNSSGGYASYDIHHCPNFSHAFRRLMDVSQSEADGGNIEKDNRGGSILPRPIMST